MRFIGAGFSPKFEDKQFMAPIILVDHFDGAVYFERTTRARPNPTGERGPYKKTSEKKLDLLSKFISGRTAF